MKPRTVSHVVSFLEALASERGASVNTIEAYRRDLADYDAYLKAKGVGRAEGGRNACARVSRRARRAEAERRIAGAPSVGDPPVSQVPLRRRLAARRPDADGRRPAPIAPAAEALEHGRGRAPDRDGARGPRGRRAPVARAAGRGAHRLSHRAHLWVGLARVGSLEPQEVDRNGQGSAHRGARQGRQGAPRAALGSRSRRNPRVPRPARSSLARARRRAPGCFPPRARAAI